MIAESSEQKESIAKQKEEKENEHIKLKLEIEQFENAHVKIKEVLGALRTQWVSLDSIYLRQDSLTQQMVDYSHRLLKERDHSLYKERLAHRFLDDYGTQDLFFADPFVEKQLKQWGDQFNLLETGVQFIQSLGDTITEEVKNYPLWPITLITTEAEKDPLRLKIKNIDKELQFPIEVITMEQARAIVQGESLDSFPIVPNHWTQNQHFSRFQEWKQKMADLAEEATKTRIEIEEKVNVWNRGAEKLANFLQEYPYGEYQERKDCLINLVNQIQELKADQKEIQLKLKEYEEKLSAQKERIDLYGQEYNGLQGKIEDAYEYLQLEKENVDLLKTQERLSKQMKEYERSIMRIDGQISSLEAEKRRLEDEERDENHNYNILIEDELYLEVKTFSPKYMNKAKNILKSEREELQLALRKLSSTRNEIQIKLDHANKDLNRFSKDISEMLLEHGPLNEDVLLPPNWNEQIDYYREKIKYLGKAVEEARQRFTEKKEEKIGQEKVLEMAISKFREGFADEAPEQFGESLSEVQDKINDEKRRLKEQDDYLQREQQRFGKELDSIKAAFYELDRFEEAHHFKGPSVTAGVLSEEDIQGFTYGRIDFVQNVTAQLKEGKANVSKEWEKVEQAKNTFKSFCKNKITNVKMREMARQGIDNKQSYKEVVEFQAHMQKRIQTAIKYNEASIINHDKQLEQYVTHINSHLRTIAGELELIPKGLRSK